VRVAVCLSGEMRGRDDCLRMLDERVMTPFRDAGAEAVDLFCHTRKDPWWGPAGKLPFRCLWVEENRPRDPSAIIGDANPRLRGERDGDDRRAFLYQSYLQQYESLAAVGLMKSRAERQDGRPYDWVVRSRPDVYLEAPLPVGGLVAGVVNVPWNDWWPYDEGGVRYDTVTDKFAAGPSAAMDVYFDRLSCLAEFCSRWRLQGERLTAWVLERAGLRWVRHEGMKVAQAEDPYRCSLRPDREA
jgi:hypothetical protein